MTLSYKPPYAHLVSDGVTPTFPYEYQIHDASEIAVYVDGVITTNYTLTGVGSVDGGDILFTVVPAEDAVVFHRRVTPKTQGTDYVDHDAGSAASLENAFDKLTRMQQDLDELASRLLTFPIALSSAYRTQFLTTPEASKVLGRNSTNNGWAWYSTTTIGAPTDALDVAFTPGGAGAVATTVQAMLRQFPSIKDFGAVGDGATDDRGAAALANAAGPFMLPAGVYVIGSNLTLTNTIHPMPGAILKVAAGVTLTINGQILAGNYQIFDADQVTTGTVALGGAKTVTPDWWGALGNGTYDDTTAVQMALDTGHRVVFTNTYYVTNVVLDVIETQVDFNRYALIGTATSAEEAVFEIKTRFSTLRNVDINANFNANYAAAIRWHSASAGAPAQNNFVFGMHIRQATYGLMFGAAVGDTSVDAAQSENTIFGFRTRAVQFPVLMNQSNGFLTLVSPILDCAPSEWASEPGYNATTFGADSLAFRADTGLLVIQGGEILKTTSQLGYGFRGKGFHITAGTTIEVASTQAFLTGSAIIDGNATAFMSNDSSPAFVVQDGSITGVLTLRGYGLSRPSGTAVTSGARFIETADAGLANYLVEMINSTITEWRWDEQFDPFYVNIGRRIINTRWETSTYGAVINFPGRNLLEGVVDANGSLLISGSGTSTPQGQWGYSHVSGGAGNAWALVALSQNIAGSRTAMAITTTGEERITSPTGRRGIPISAGNPYIFSAYTKADVSGTIVARVYFYQWDGQATSSPVTSNFTMSATTSLQHTAYLFAPPVDASYAAIEFGILGGTPFTATITGVSLVEATGRDTITGIIEALSTTATLDFGDTASGAASDLTVLVPGILLADPRPVEVGVPNGSIVAGAAGFYGWVSADNQVTVRFWNASGGNLNPASGVFAIRVPLR